MKITLSELEYIQRFYDFISIYKMAYKDFSSYHKNPPCIGEIAFRIYSSFHQLRDGTFNQQINGELRGYNNFLLLNPEKTFFIINKLSEMSDFKKNSFLKKCIFFCYSQKLKILFFQAVNTNHLESNQNAVDLSKDIVDTLYDLINLKNQLDDSSKYKSYYMFYDNLPAQNEAFDYLYNLFTYNENKILETFQENNFENDSFNIFFNYISCIYKQIESIPSYIGSLSETFQTNPSINASVFGLGTLPMFHIFLSFKKPCLLNNLKFPQNENSIESGFEDMGNLQETFFNQINISRNICNAFQKILFPETIIEDIHTNNIYNDKHMRVFLQLLNEYLITHNVNKENYSQNVFNNLSSFQLTSATDINFNNLFSIIRENKLTNSLIEKNFSINQKKKI